MKHISSSLQALRNPMIWSEGRFYNILSESQIPMKLNR